MQTQQNSSQDNKNLRISFIVTTYNLSSEMLKRCLESIFALSLRPDEREIIVIDDGSDFSPLGQIEDRLDNIIYLRQPNQGVSVARNTGIRIATGEYIQFIDGDDWLVQAPYEHCLDIVRYQNPDIVLFDMTTKDVAHAEFTDEGPVEGNQYMLHNNIKAQVGCYIFKKSTMVNLRFTPGTKYGEDEEFTPQLILRSERLFATEAKAYHYTQHKNSVTHKRKREDIRERLDNNFDVICRLQYRADRLPKQDREALQRRVAQLTMDYIYNIIRFTHDSNYLEACIGKLYDKGLFPLPDRDYTKKYKWFRRMVNSEVGRKLLILTLRR